MPSWTQQGAWHKHPAREASISADADLNQKIVMALRRREPAIDFQSAHEGGFAGRPDPEMLAIAAGAGRVLVSHDRRTMIRHFAGFLRNQTSPGRHHCFAGCGRGLGDRGSAARLGGD